MTFKEYLAAQPVLDTIGGDVIRDAQTDRRMPDVKTWAELRAYLGRRCETSTRSQVVRELRKVWTGYQAETARKAV